MSCWTLLFTAAAAWASPPPQSPLAPAPWPGAPPAGVPLQAPLTVDQALARFAHEPDVRLVHRWAEQHAQVDPAAVARWLRASERFGALPTVWVRYRLTDSWDQDHRYYAKDGLVDTEDEPLFAALEDAGTGQQAQYTVQAQWDLGQLVFSSERLRAIDQARDATEHRDELLTEVNRLYFERRRIQVEGLLAPKLELLGQVKDALAVRELTAHLDALTGGRFSAALAQGR